MLCSLYLLKIGSSHSAFIREESEYPWRLASFSSISRPLTIFSSRSSFLNHCLILDLASLVLTIFSQSRLGPCGEAEVIISTISPVLSCASSVTIRPLILAPMHLCPIAECIAYAKSRGVEPAGKSITSPLGVKTNTSSLNKSVRTLSINSRESLDSASYSSILRSQAIFSSMLLFFPEAPSLYFQCAAMPYSAVSCIF